MIRLKLSVKIKSITGINSTFPQRERESVRACVRVCVCVFVHRSHNLNKQQVQETQKQYAYLKIYPCIVLINSTNNRYRKHKGQYAYMKMYPCIVLINSTNNRYKKHNSNTLI